MEHDKTCIDSWVNLDGCLIGNEEGESRKENKSKLFFDFRFSRKNYFQVLSLCASGGSDFVICRLSSFVTLLCFTYHALWGFAADRTPGTLDTIALKSCRTGRLGNQFPTFQVVLFGCIHINFSVFYVKKASRQCRGRESNRTSDYTSITFIAARAGSRTQMIDKAMVLFNNWVVS